MAEHRVDRSPTRTATKPATGGPGGDAPSVLVVDDDEENRELLSRRVERLGYTVAVADSGRRALDTLAATAFDLVLLDIVMPGMDGFQVLARLKADAAWRHIPVIVLSALDEVASIVTCIQLGAEDYLPKPFDPPLLGARMRSALEKGRRGDNTPVAGHGLTPREGEVLRLLAAGHSDRAIADALFISHLTARTHVTHLLAKLGVNTRTAAAAYAFAHGLA